MTGTRKPPVLVVPLGGDVAAAARDVARQEWRLHQGFGLPAEPWDLTPQRLVVFGTLSEEVSAQAALLCVVRGAGLVVAVDRTAPWVEAFLADLERLRPAGDAPRPSRGGPRSEVPLTDEQRALLELLAEGHSIAQAARRLYLSLRTANRRVAEARSTLGVATTREAVLAYVRLRAGQSGPDGS